MTSANRQLQPEHRGRQLVHCLMEVGPSRQLSGNTDVALPTQHRQRPEVGEVLAEVPAGADDQIVASVSDKIMDPAQVHDAGIFLLLWTCHAQ